MASAYATVSIPAPPHSLGTATPPSPSSKAFFTVSAGYLCSRSHRLALGFSSRSANSRQVSRRSLCSSVNSISMLRGSRSVEGKRVFDATRAPGAEQMAAAAPKGAAHRSSDRPFCVLRRILVEIRLAVGAAERVDAALVRRCQGHCEEQRLHWAPACASRWRAIAL